MLDQPSLSNDLNQYASKYYPITEEQEKSKEVGDESKAESKTESNKKAPKRFRVIATGCSGTIFIQVDDDKINPLDFVTKIFKDPNFDRHTLYEIIEH